MSFIPASWDVASSMSMAPACTLPRSLVVLIQRQLINLILLVLKSSGRNPGVRSITWCMDSYLRIAAVGSTGTHKSRGQVHTATLLGSSWPRATALVS